MRYIRKTVYFVIYLLSLIWSLTLNAENMAKPQFKFQPLAGGENFAHSETLVQDKQGMVWIGTQTGLYKFDGIESQLLTTENSHHSLLSNYISTLFIDSKENVWIGSNIGLSKLNPKTELFVHFSSAVNVTDKADYSLKGSQVNAITEDATGNIWVATNLGLNKVEGDLGKANYYVSHLDNVPFAEQTIQTMTVDQQDRFWLGTESGLYYTPHASRPDEFIQYRDKNLPKAIEVSALFVTKEKELWIGSTRKGLFQLNLNTLETTRQFEQDFNGSISRINKIGQDNRGNLWLAMIKGLGFINKDHKSLFIYQYKANDKYGLWSDRIKDLLIDNKQNIWLINAQGLLTLNPASSAFTVMAMDKNNQGALQEKSISEVSISDDEHLWIGGSSTGLYEFIEKKGLHHQENKNSIFNLPFSDTQGLLHDTQGRIWIGLHENGIYKISADRKTRKHYQRELNNPNSLKSNRRNEIIFEDHLQRIWIGDMAGLNLYNELTDDFIHPIFVDASNNVIQEGRVLAITEMNQQLIVGTSSGAIYYFNNNEDVFQPLIINNEKGTPISLQLIAKLQVNKGVLWIASYGAGLLRGQVTGLKEKKAVFSGKLFNHRQGLAENTINSFYFNKYNSNEIWLNADFGIASFDVNKETFVNYTAKDGVPFNTFYINCSAQSAQGVIYFCGADGILHFQPDDIKSNQSVPEVTLTNFYINNQLIRPDATDEQAVLVKTLNHTASVMLNYDETNFAFDFAALDYSDPLKNQYAYMLAGFDKDWVPTTAKRRHANYSNIPAGDYTFKVKASNNHGFWNEQGTQINITVLPPWYLTWWAKALWLLSFSLIIFAFIRYRTQQQTREIKQRSFELEKAVDDRTAELKQAQKTIINQEKMSSLGTLSAGIAHEINNPTNFVYGSCQNMAEDLKQFKQFLHDLAGDDADEAVLEAFEQQFTPLHGHLNIIGEGAQRIKKIVGGLSSFSRSDQDEMEIITINQCLETTTDLVNTEYKDVTTFELDFTDNAEVLCFPSKINQVVMNLLVNASQAIKAYKPSQAVDYFGCIRISSTIVKNDSVVKITDNGQGIPVEHLAKIFDPFFTTKDVGSGTGLGLSLSYEIVQQHGGHLLVESTENIGTCFTLVLPLSQQVDAVSLVDKLSPFDVVGDS
jgi:signal transduction histidine kinase/ligand-binding sensor domain-containing protein